MNLSPKTLSVGEVAFFNEFRAQKGTCTCEEPFNTCHLWGSLNADYTIKKSYSIFESFRRLLGIISKGHPTQSSRPPDDTYELFAELLERHPTVEYIIDSSKDPRRLWDLLAQKDRLNVFPVFLVKDGVSVAKSYEKHSQRCSNFFRAYLFRWKLVNLLATRMTRISHGMTIKYEDLCDRLESSIGSINAWLDLNLPTTNIPERLNDKRREGVFHNIGGNGVRFREIRTIEKRLYPRQNLSSVEKAFTNLIP